MQQFWDQRSKFKVEMWDQAGNNIPRYDPEIARKHLRYVSLNIKLFHFLLSENNVTYLRTIHKNNEEKYYNSRHSISLTDTFLRNLQCLSGCLVG